MICGSRSAEMNISTTLAMEIAQSFLDVVCPEIPAYYGYYTVITIKDGGHYGMVNVDGTRGTSGTICGTARSFPMWANTSFICTIPCGDEQPCIHVLFYSITSFIADSTKIR